MVARDAVISDPKWRAKKHQNPQNHKGSWVPE